MGRLTTHVLDTASGRPGAGIRITLYRNLGERYALVRDAVTNATAAATRRCSKARRSPQGRYRLVFAVGEYFAAQGTALPDPPFVDEVVLDFGVADAAAHYHVPLLVSPWSYSTYRGLLMVEAYALDWVQLVIRWVHLITGIAWIGASFYFVFLDNSLLPPKRKEDADAGVGGELWAIHGGGFYHAQKFRVAPATLPGAAALVQVGGVLDVDVRLRALRRHVLRARRAVHDRPQRRGHRAVAGDRDLARAARRRLDLLRPALQARGPRPRARGRDRHDRVPRRRRVGAVAGVLRAARCTCRSAP